MNEYVNLLGKYLKPKITQKERVLDLFAGCGGLSLGFESVGYEVIGYEMKSDAVATYNKNLLGRCYQEKLTKDFIYDGSFEMIIGGPPCQPFSAFGHQKGSNDDRNGFPIFVEAVKNIQPNFWLFENVRGMLFKNKKYFENVISELKALGYIVEYKLLNAVNYQVPQKRERLFVVGHRGKFSFPISKAKIITVGEAISDIIDREYDETKLLTPSMDKYVKKYENASQCINPRDLIMDKPARTLTCRNIAAPTGDMQRVKLLDGKRRRISVREAARLQSFPDWFEFIGTETDKYYQIGNAVPPMLAYNLAVEATKYFEIGQLYSSNEILSKKHEIN